MKNGSRHEDGSCGVQMQGVFVTPSLAQEWLKKNRNNRRISAERVNLFADMMKAGNWHATHQGVAFYEDGDLADGQTRLTAIVKAGVGVWMYVAHGLRRESIHAIDGGRPRAVRDVLHFLGMSFTQQHVAVMRVLWMQYQMQRSDGSTTWDASAVDSTLMAQFARATQECIDFAMPETKSRGVSHSCCVAAVASAWWTQDRSCLARFQHLVMSGAGADSDEQAAIKVREFLLTTNLLTGGNEARQELFMRCCTALRAFIERRPISRLYCRPDAVFPIPDLI